ncbi:P27 family phage terminase small subunit [Phascolarctobacterium faecium]|uniref:P27 family phage terminase small subunit n=1 Tax=Phascolarctobacterium faecium TaxID=33025 RepID=UPI00351FED91
MAKDGTNRGGRRVRAGDKPMSAAEKIQRGREVRVMNNDIPSFTPTELDAVDLPEGAVMNGADMPKPSEYLSAKQKNGIPLGADEIYKETWRWLKERNCEKLVNKRLIEAYSQAFARYIQCEEATSTYGLLGKHPTTGGVMASPFVQMSQQYQKSANLIWYEIYDIVKQNCTEVFEDNPNDTMELLLRARKK